MFAGTGTPLGVALTRLAAAEPETPALTCGGVTLSRRELDERANRLAWELRDHGVRVGDRVAIVLPNGIDFVVALLAAWKAGGTPVPVSDRLPAAEREPVLELARPVVVIAASGPGTIPPSAGDGQPESAPPGIVPQPWKILASGGSTGRPKLIATVEPGIAERAGLFGLAAQMSEGGAALVTAPLTHNGPFMSLTAALLFGKHVVLMERFGAAEALRLAERRRVDWMYAVPTMMHRIWRLPEADRTAADLSALRVLFHLGAPIAPWLKQAWIDWLGPERIWELYAGTEAQAVTRISGTEWLAHRGSVGRPLTGDIEVRDELGRPLGPGRVGQVWMRPDAGPTYTYIGATARSDGRWECLGDLGYIDADGYLYLTDRDTDMILVGGSNVYPAEIEGVLEEHPAVRSAAVIGLPDEDLGSVPHAIVQADADVDEAALLAHLRERLAAYKLPRTFEFVTVPLRDDAGKIRRAALRAARLPAGPRAAAGTT
ncbi:AMP-binding protein [Actinoallomurus rhizosphaericola]|uniref:AMP-binding protein n=1 Tax=Actinoallomurus rhizosphaericola TaxID=2952536 RepID=UPI002093A907|nr:AMP-binding protein [Actinoallomurus rhizosphaericola]MCO5999428.1 AMP-binding protein [Actinoallomurus rhizosphaericola]